METKKMKIMEKAENKLNIPERCKTEEEMRKILGLKKLDKYKIHKLLKENE